ncbi:MAG: peptide chain release factor 2 [Candidatus Falkowbacteria bacterium]|nr:peptide chain release factor 2 [Candidatus Falkowbacteria bacterium]
MPKLANLSELGNKFEQLKELLAYNSKQVRLLNLKEIMSEPDFWQNQLAAANVGREAERLQTELNSLDSIEKELVGTDEMITMSLSENDEALKGELVLKVAELETQIAELEFYSLLGDDHDDLPAILSIHAGVGGVDAQDWAMMLERMYLRFAERRGFKIEIIDRLIANEAGIKSVSLRITGPYAFGYLKSENGVHRLARISPFDGESLRQTSFALVEVIPELPENDEVIIKDEDLRVDLFRSSGPGGQNVNKTESAIRLTHIPTGIVVACQSERSQHQNRENAMKILKGKIFQLEQEKREAAEKNLKGGVVKAEWGRQIRSYILYGARLVKDHRTNHETTEVDRVLDGDLLPFMEAYLKWKKM